MMRTYPVDPRFVMLAVMSDGSERWSAEVHAEVNRHYRRFYRRGDRDEVTKTVIATHLRELTKSRLIKQTRTKVGVGIGAHPMYYIISTRGISALYTFRQWLNGLLAAPRRMKAYHGKRRPKKPPR